jgi:hypothetical protein
MAARESNTQRQLIDARAGDLIIELLRSGAAEGATHRARGCNIALHF